MCCCANVNNGEACLIFHILHVVKKSPWLSTNEFHICATVIKHLSLFMIWCIVLSKWVTLTTVSFFLESILYSCNLLWNRLHKGWQPIFIGRSNGNILFWIFKASENHGFSSTGKSNHCRQVISREHQNQESVIPYCWQHFHKSFTLLLVDTS